MYNKKYVIAIIVAAGKGTRMGAKRPKQYLVIDDNIILVKTIEQFEKNNNIDEIILVVNDEDLEFVKTKISCDRQKIRKVVVGGSSRIESVYNGLSSVDKKDSIVLIHDGVRPFVSQTLINNIIEGAYSYDACIPVLDIKDTVKEINEDKKVECTIDRNKYKAVQTPQGFTFDIIYKCYEKAIEDNTNVTDDASLLEKYGYEVSTIKGLEKNIKITTKFDLRVAELISRMV